MLVLQLSQVKARASRKYHQNRTGWLPKRMSWMEPGAAAEFERMNLACDNRMTFTDIYRSTMTQILAIRGASKKKRRLYAPPTKSGHNFAFSTDVDIDETLENFRKSRTPELVAASRDHQALGRWMLRFGFSGISRERWHFNFLGEHTSTLKKIDAVYGVDLAMANEDLQRALNRLVGNQLKEPLVIDGALGVKTTHAAKLAQPILGYDDQGEFSGWFRRLVAGATVRIKEVPPCSPSTPTS
jgi:hypothetical protein